MLGDGVMPKARVGRWGQEMRSGRGLIVSFFAMSSLAACGMESESSTRQPEVPPGGRGPIQTLTEAGATPREAACIARAMKHSPEDAYPRGGNLQSSLERMIVKHASKCAPEDRLRDIAFETAELIEQQTLEDLEPLIDQFAAEFEAVGATDATAHCVAESIATSGWRIDEESFSSKPGSAASARDRERIMAKHLEEVASHCAPLFHLRVLAHRVIVR